MIPLNAKNICFVSITLLLASILSCSRTIYPPRLMVQNYTVYYGSHPAADISQFDLAIIDPDQIDDQGVHQLRDSGTVVLAYLNLGEVERYRTWFDRVNPRWIIAANPDWSDHFIVDASQTGWQNLIVRHVVPQIYDKDFDGLFLDRIDIADRYNFPHTRKGIVSIIRAIKQSYPEKFLILNNGVFLGRSIFKIIDGILIESLFMDYDSASKSYLKKEAQEIEARIDELRFYHNKYGLTIFTLDYVPMPSHELIQHVLQKSKENGFIPYISTRELDKIFLNSINRRPVQ